MYGCLTQCLHSHSEEKPKLFGLQSKTTSIFVLQCSHSMHLNKFLTMHESESEELQKSWDDMHLLQGIKEQDVISFFAMLTILKLMPFGIELFQLWWLGTRNLA